MDTSPNENLFASNRDLANNNILKLTVTTLIIQQSDNKRFICDFMSISYDLLGFIYVILKKFEL